jgi:hypothetical protein
MTTAGGPGNPAASPAPGAAWVLLPGAWCAWLLAWLVPSFLVAPHLAVERMWLVRETAPQAILAAAAFFVVAVWPFWPALARRKAPRAAVSPKWLALSVLELVMLVALAAPFVLVAWSVGGKAILAGPLAATAGAWAVFGLGLRIAATTGQGAARWLMLAAVLVSVGPLILGYAAGETLGVGVPRLVEASPIVSGIGLALGGWPEGAWPWISAVALWPAVGMVLGLVGWWRTCLKQRAPSPPRRVFDKLGG